MPVIATTVATDSTTRYGRSGRLCVRTHRQATSCGHQAAQAHSAHSRLDSVTIHYPYHPRFGDVIVVLARRKHQGKLAVLIEQPDGSRTWLPVWMTQPSAARLQCVEWPAIMIQRLLDLHRLLRVGLASVDDPFYGSQGDDTKTTGAMRSPAARKNSGNHDFASHPSNGSEVDGAINHRSVETHKQSDRAVRGCQR